MELSDSDLLLPAEELLKKHKITYGDAPAYSSEVIGLINMLTRMLFMERKKSQVDS